MRICVTGGTGFVGRALVSELASAGHRVRLALRQPVARNERDDVEYVSVGDIGPYTEWDAALDGVDSVIHLAARAHVMRESAPCPAAAFDAVNFEGTKRLADACCKHAKPLLHLSSIGVYGSVDRGQAFNESSAPDPDTPYARSKLLADRYLQDLGRKYGLRCIILRSPLVYGANAPGNLRRLMEAVRRGWPIPVSDSPNRRSLVGIDHLVRAIRALVEIEHAERRVYCVADKQVLSTEMIVRAIAQGVGRTPRIVTLPSGALRLLGTMTGQSKAVERLVGSLEVDATRFRSEVGDFQRCGTIEGLVSAAASTSR